MGRYVLELKESSSQECKLDRKTVNVLKIRLMEMKMTLAVFISEENKGRGDLCGWIRKKDTWKSGKEYKKFSLMDKI